MVFFTGCGAFVQQCHHAGVLLGADGTAKALSKLLLNFWDDFGVFLIAQIWVLMAFVIADRVWNWERQFGDNQQ